MKEVFKSLKEVFLAFLERFKENKNKILASIPIFIIVVALVSLIAFESCHPNESADISTVYADDLGLEDYNYSPITGYVSLDSTSEDYDVVYSLFNQSQYAEYLINSPAYSGGNDYVVLHLAPYILYPAAVWDMSYDVYLYHSFETASGVKGYRVTYIVEYYDEAVGDTPTVEFSIDYTTELIKHDLNLMFEIMTYMDWLSEDSIFVLSTRIFVTAPTSVNVSGIIRTAGIYTQFDNTSNGISYAGYLYELGDYISTATADITVVPITNQIVDMVNNFLSLEIFPGVSFYVILLMAVIIPFVVVILKLWFGG